MTNKNIIAIDGPAGSGKSSVAKALASKMDFNYFDSGSYYRAMTLFYFRIYSSLKSNQEFSEWFSNFAFQDFFSKIKLTTEFDTSEQNKTYLNGEDVSKEIRSIEITEQIKHLAANSEIREFVNAELRELVRLNKIIMDGRDIGTEVFPDAKYKFFLDASIEVRAERRYAELADLETKIDLDSLKEDIRRRDESDRNRKIAPLKKHSDAILIDTSNLPKNVVINMILSKVLE